MATATLDVKVKGPWWALFASGSARRFLAFLLVLDIVVANALAHMGVSDAVQMAMLGLAGTYITAANVKQVFADRAAAGAPPVGGD